MRVTKALVFGLLIAVFSGCGSTDRLRLSNALSSDIQLRINSAKEYDADFQFSPHPEGDEILVESSTTTSKAVYSINEPMRGRLTQLMRLKFGSISQSSDNKVNVSIDNIQTENSSSTFVDGSHLVSMDMQVKIRRDGETFTRTISRSAEVEIEVIEEIGRPINLDERQINEFMNQFVVGVNSFIDSNFGVE